MATAHRYQSNAENGGAIPSGKNRRIALVVSEWNPEITENLYKGAQKVLLENGVAANDIFRTTVPGSFELVYGAKKAIQMGVDAVIVIGSVIQGETRHFDFVCQGVTQGVQMLNVQYDVPVIFCVLTDNTLEQAQARSGGVLGNKGEEAAVAALKMASI
ncbi:MAG: 6,7-dimethyl-8-ribityllumazine synthase [Bacteroidetes bacterium]|nr:6,7-dimethyl-8-ribityllumazine synthase [Bacteroidota bacterium]MDA1344954.1 6,7-dimethyl-8-ribityllumazine synthase [Bacteroidota bacterium]